MLIEFRVTNFRSFKDEQVLSMVASSDKSLPENVAPVENFGKRCLLKSAVVYGANASGKSNLVKAMAFAKNFIMTSSRRDPDDPTGATPFRFDIESSMAPTKFEFSFSQENIRYVYGFALDDQMVHAEWLVAYPRGLPQRWFDRVYDSATETYEWNFGVSFKGDKKGLRDLTRPHMLLLSVANNLEHPQLTTIRNWFKQGLIVLDDGMSRQILEARISERVQQEGSLREMIEDLLHQADLGISGVVVETEEALVMTSSPSLKEIQRVFRELQNSSVKTTTTAGPTKEVVFQRTRIKLAHCVEPQSDTTITLDFQDESMGTRRVFGLGGPLYDALRSGATLVVDELDASLHPTLVRHLVETFHDPVQNRHYAQLIFNTHDTTLLDSDLFRRDQIWFVEKDKTGASRLYPLLEFSPRKDEALEKGYLKGRYGAIPFISRPTRSLIPNGQD